MDNGVTKKSIKIWRHTQDRISIPSHDVVAVISDLITEKSAFLPSPSLSRERVLRIKERISADSQPVKAEISLAHARRRRDGCPQTEGSLLEFCLCCGCHKNNELVVPPANRTHHRPWLLLLPPATTPQDRASTV